MPFSTEDRRIRNSKQDKIAISERPPAPESMAEGEIIMSRLPNKQLGLFVKYKSLIWKTYLSPDGNGHIDKSLFVNDSIRSKKAITSSVAVVNSVAPTAHVDNQISILSKDASSSSESTLHLFLEEDPIADVNIFQSGDPTSHKLKIWINGVEYYIGLQAV
jgi:hypothetical protein